MECLSAANRILVAKIEPSSVRMNPYSLAQLIWPYDRKGLPFKFRTVEPHEYEPDAHGMLFSAVMGDLINPMSSPLDPYSEFAKQAPLDFDLVTFPEAFVPAPLFVETLDAIREIGPTGCFHVGLRPSDASNHLFSAAGAGQLVDKLAQLAPSVNDDLVAFRGWLHGLSANSMINLASIFMVDANAQLRVCLHPKLVRSSSELSVRAEETMVEGTLLTVLSLIPTGGSLSTINVQPLICADATNLKPDTGLGGPIQVLNMPDCFAGNPPDHIDVVSVVTCTTQQTGKGKAPQAGGHWHERFKATFQASENYLRHSHASFVMSNFRKIEEGSPAGGSGVFMPVRPPKGAAGGGIQLSCFGRPRDQPTTWNRWSDDEDPLSWSSLAFTLGLAPWPHAEESVRVLQGTIVRLPREDGVRVGQAGVADCRVRVGRANPDGSFSFEFLPEAV